MEIYQPGSRIGQYEIASKPMMGGMGVVYFALDHGNNGKPVALKTFKPEFLPDREARDRFLREGTTWVNLGSHPNIVKCHAVEYIDPTAFLSLELIAKEQEMEDSSLRAWLGQPLPLEQALLFGLQIARGMQHATRRIPGFVHRDLKPENVLVGADKLPGTNVNRLRVTDFGLATMLADKGGRLIIDEDDSAIGRTRLTNGIIGTPLYMAPEQWRGEEVGVYTDVYAFGCILYEMLDGMCAVDGQTISDLRSGHCAGGAGRLVSVSDNIPREVKNFLGQCLSLHPMERRQGWEDITKELERVYRVLVLREAPAEMNDAQTSREETLQTGWSYNRVGWAYLDMGKVEIAKDHFTQSLSIARKIGDQIGEGAALVNLGIAYAILGDMQHAIGYYEESLQIHREIGYRSAEGAVLVNLGKAYGKLGEVQHEIECYQKALAILREVGDRRAEGATLLNLGRAWTGLGATQRAVECCGQALAISREVGDQRGEGNAFRSLGNAYQVLGEMQRAIEYYEQSIEIAREIGDLLGESETLEMLPLALAQLGEIERAIRYCEKALAISHEMTNPNGTATAIFNMAWLYATQGDISRALSLAQEAEKIFAQIGNSKAQVVQQLIALLQASAVDQSNRTQVDPEAAFQAFQLANSPSAMHTAVAQYPFMTEDVFIQVIEHAIKERIPSNLQPAFEQRLVWLKQIAASDST